MWPMKNNSSVIVNPFAPQKAKIEIDVNLVTQQCGVKCDVSLPALLMADILIQSASGILKQLMQSESMIVGKAAPDSAGEGIEAEKDKGE